MGEMSELFLGFSASDMFCRDLDAAMRGRPFVSSPVTGEEEETNDLLPELPKITELYEPIDTPVLNRFEVSRKQFQKKRKDAKTMAIDFDKIDKSVDLKGLQADVEEAKKNGGGDFPTIPAGKYEVKLETMEIKGTKADPNRPMLAVSFKILAGEFKNQRLFMNRVLYGTKNDKNMIASAMGFLEKLDSGVPISFQSYRQFSNLVMDVMEAVDGKLEYAVDYDDSRFNSISIDEVFEVDG